MEHFDFFNYFLAFLEGCALILSPCILPILPILLSGAIASDKRGPLGIITGFTITFALFTLGSHYLITYLGINLDHLRDVAFVLIALFGLVMVSDYLTEKFSAWTQNLANFSMNLSAGKPQTGFWGGLLLGSLVGLVWTPCAGPILAAALIQIAVQKTFFSSAMALFAFALGSIMPMLIIALLGKKLLHSIKAIKKHTNWLRKFFGAVIIITALILAYISHFKPDLLASLASPAAPIEKNLDKPSGNLIDPLIAPYQAPSLAELGPWINSPPLTLDSLKGKVVLIDFWTYSCINCLRTLPYLLAWDKAYRDQGLVIIGIHTPEFEFEKNSKNVEQAVERLGILYPVALDNQYATWSNYKNHYWPAHYLIDKQGKVVYRHFGEGEYSTMEHNIRILLDIDSSNKMMTNMLKEAVPSEGQTPETYLGYDRSENFASPQRLVNDHTVNYTFPSRLPQNHWALRGAWQINGEKIVAMSPGAAVKIHFQSKAVYVVMGTATGTSSHVKILLDNQPIGSLTVTGQRLYEIAQFSHATQGEIILWFETPGVELYTFTFG